MSELSPDVADWQLAELLWASRQLLLSGATEGGDSTEQSEEVQDCFVHGWDTGSVHFPVELVWEHNGEA